MRAFLFFLLILMITMNFKINDVSTSLKYLIKHPKIENSKTPLLILLHGVGSNEKDLFSFANQLPDDFMVVSARAPFEVSSDSYAWYEVSFSDGKPAINKDKAEKSRNLIIEFINQLKEKYKFDDRQVYLCGFSQGGIMAYSVGLTRPDKVKGIAVMSGRLLEEVKPIIKPSDQLKQLNVFITHGTNDNVLGVNYAKESISYLKGLGINPTFKEYSEGHTISNDMIHDLIYWLNNK